jgi:hypothetical protein
LTYRELHRLGASSTELAGNNHLTTLGTALHDETKHTVAGTSDSKTVQQLVAERLALGDRGQTAVLDLGGIEGDRVLGELEALLDERGELTDATTLFTQNLLSVGGTDNCRKTYPSAPHSIVLNSHPDADLIRSPCVRHRFQSFPSKEFKTTGKSSTY